MIHGLVAAIAVILRFAFLFGIYYLIKGVLLLSGRRLPLRGQEGMSKEDWEKWAAGEGRVCLYWAVILQGGQYLLQLGCTGYEGDKLVVYHRLYDVCCIQNIGDKTTVGYFDMDSQVELL